MSSMQILTPYLEAQFLDTPLNIPSALSDERECEDMATAVVLVDDDDLFRESLGRNLSDAGYAVRDFSNGAAALEYLLGGREPLPSLIILDWRMPEMNGIEVLRRLRGAKVEVPTLFLTALTDQIYEEAALTTGAVDFVEKSRSFAILEKRIALILGGIKAGEPVGDGARLERGRLVLDLDINRAFWAGLSVDLTLTEFRIVHLLAGHPGKDVSYRGIYDQVHGEGFMAGTGDEGFRANVRTFVKRIRQKFRDVDPEFDQIANYAGFGYHWRPDA